jgi:hypothetical protein
MQARMQTNRLYPLSVLFLNTRGMQSVLLNIMKTSILGKLLPFGHQQHTGFLSVSRLCSFLIAVRNTGPFVYGLITCSKHCELLMDLIFSNVGNAKQLMCDNLTKTKPRLKGRYSISCMY